MDELKGVGHFTFWFIQGFVIFKLLLLIKPNCFRLKVYGPFIPFVMGFVAIVPYVLIALGVITQGQAMAAGYNVFFLYGWLNSLGLVVRIFANFHLAVVLTGVAYVALIFHYIQLVKATRKKYAK